MVKKPLISLYKQPADVYDSMMSTELESGIFKVVTREVKKNLKKDKTKLLDLCCGTGIIAKMLAKENKIDFVGVDINRILISEARDKLKNRKNFRFIQEDALKFKSKNNFDIVVLTSAYHHIKNKDKNKLLENIYKLLDDNGILIIYEKAIRPFSNKIEFRKSNEEFYLKRINYLRKTEKNRLSKKQYEALLNICGLSVAGEEEYKIYYDYLISDLHKAKFKIKKEIKIWPKTRIFNNSKIGDFVFIAAKI